MPNQIRPSSQHFVPGAPIVLDVLIEQTVTAYTWVVAREPIEGYRHIAAEGWRPKTGTRRPPASSSVTVPPELTDGDYVVRLFAGKPVDGDLESFLSSAELLDEDTFTVTGAGTEAALRGSHVPAATLARFRSRLAARWEHEDGYDDNEWPALGVVPYRALLDAAREFVGRTTVSSPQDLIPDEYAQDLPDGTRRLPKLVDLPTDPSPTNFPAIELIWNYWLEEGMLVQTLDAILARFDDLRRPGPDPLARFDIAPLLPIRSRLVAYGADEANRTTTRRRNAEYEYEYGFSLIGRSLPSGGISTRSQRHCRFVESFHRVLFLAHRYLRDLDNLTVHANPFDLYLALRDCHLVLAENANARNGQMAIAIRAEFLVIQSLLAEPQMRVFLGRRTVDAHPEPWMNRVDSMARLQGWPDTGVIHFNDLAVCGEQLLLTIRRCSWADPGTNEHDAANWVQIFRTAVQRYVAGYRMVAGVDLTQETMPNAVPNAVSALEPHTMSVETDGGETRARQHAGVLRAIAAALEAEAHRTDC